MSELRGRLLIGRTWHLTRGPLDRGGDDHEVGLACALRRRGAPDSLRVSGGGDQSLQDDLLRPFEHACADETGTNHLSAFSITGLAFNGTDLTLSCWGDNTITLIHPHTGGQDGVYSIVDGSGTPLAGIGALAWDAPDGVLWGCNLSAYPLKEEEQGEGRRLHNARPVHDDRVFTHVLNASGGCDNGVAYDPYGGEGPSLWTASVSTTLSNYSLDGDMLGQQPVATLLGGWGGGMAFTANAIYVADPQTKTKAIYRLPPDFSGSTSILSGSHRFEDMECDATTFAPRTVIWVEWFNQNAAKPIHISGGC